MSEPAGARTGKPADRGPRVGFLPIETNWFDRCFIGVVLWVALNLLWMRFLEDAIALPFASLLFLPVFIFIVLRG